MTAFSLRRFGAAAVAGCALFALAGAGQPDISARPPNGTYAYAITLGGRPIGAYTTVVASTARTLSSKQTFTRTQLGPVTSTSTIVYDPRGLREISYTSQIQPQSGDLQNFSVGNAGNSIDISLNKAANVNVPAQKNAPVLLLDDDFGPSDLFLPAILRASNAKVASLFFVRTGLGTLLRVVADDPAPRPAFVPPGDASITVEYQSEIVIHEVLWYDPSTFVLHALEVPGTSVEIKLTSFTPA